MGADFGCTSQGYLSRLTVLKPLLSAWVFLCLSVGSSDVSANDIYIYPRSESLKDSRQRYPVAILEHCSAQSKFEWSINPSQLLMNQGRSIRQLAKNQDIDILWTVTSKEREQTLLPIRIPIDRGLIGWRLFLIAENRQPVFDLIDSVDALKTLAAGQGHDWPDTAVLLRNGFKVSTTPNYEPLFDMLALDHIDYFPRSVAEIQREQQQHIDQHIIIEKNLALHYPAALYFFVNPKNVKLAERLTSCLNEMVATGELKRLFYSYYGIDIKKANLPSRRIFTVPNELLSADTPLNQPALWFNPEEQEE